MKLASNRLIQVYDLAPPRTLQYLKAELDFALTRIKPGEIEYFHRNLAWVIPC